MVGLWEGGSPEPPPPMRNLENPGQGESAPLLSEGVLLTGGWGLPADGGAGGAGGVVTSSPSSDCCWSLSCETIGFHELRRADDGEGGVVAEVALLLLSGNCGLLP